MFTAHKIGIIALISIFIMLTDVTVLALPASSASTAVVSLTVGAGRSVSTWIGACTFVDVWK